MNQEKVIIKLITILMRYRGKKDRGIFPSMVGAIGFEPVTSAVSRECS